MPNKRSSGTVVISQDELASGESPRPQGDACIVLLHPPGPDIGRRTALSDDSYIVGRDNSADLVIPRNAVSRHHSRLVKDDQGHWWIEDLGSTNGTFVNETRIKRHLLTDSDQIRFGDTIFKFLSGSNIESAYHEEIYRMTIVDGLTGVYNKRYFLEFLEREVASAHRHKRPLSLVMFDIDYFKHINDQRGHLAGDAVLKELCNRIRTRIRREDLFARYGGEEFAAILTVTPLEGAIQFADHVRGLVSERPFEFEDESIPVTVSAGVSCLFPGNHVDALSLIRRADENLYEAKRRGRNRVVPSADEVSVLS